VVFKAEMRVSSPGTRGFFFFLCEFRERKRNRAALRAFPHASGMEP